MDFFLSWEMSCKFCDRLVTKPESIKHNYKLNCWSMNFCIFGGSYRSHLLGSFQLRNSLLTICITLAFTLFLELVVSFIVIDFLCLFCVELLVLHLIIISIIIIIIIIIIITCIFIIIIIITITIITILL